MFLFHHFKDRRYMMFPEEQEFKDTLPKLFRTFKNIRASVDLQSLNVKCHAITANMEFVRYSSYKSHCTVKCFITVNPNGAACFISDLFEGRHK